MWDNKKANLLIYKGLASKKVVPLGLQQNNFYSISYIIPLFTTLYICI